MQTLDDYDFLLPDELIATMPLKERTNSRLLALKAGDTKVRHDYFNNIGQYLKDGDALVINNTKVMPARIYGHKITGAKVAVLLIKPLAHNQWTALIQGKGPFKTGTKILLNNDKEHYLTVLDRIEEEPGSYLIACDFDLRSFAYDMGEMPLPPYFGRKALAIDLVRYQTVYAKTSDWGAVAAPTAGLHFSNELLASLKLRNIKVVETTLHVGPGTFLPIRCQNIDDHKMHKESFVIDEDAANTLNETKKNGGRIIAVGSTSMRVIEQVMQNSRLNNQHEFFATSGETALFIKPGFKFLGCDAIITNFHLPRSTLFVLICAVLGKKRALLAYEEAVKEKYRFFSYGDACFFEIMEKNHA